MADRDLGEADLAGELGQLALVLAVAVAMQQHDGDRADAAGERGRKLAPGGGAVERPQHLALGGHPLVDLDHRLVEQLRQHDAAVEQPRPVLVGDAQRVGEAPGDRQHGAVALALEQRVGRDRRAHLDRGDRVRRDRVSGGDPEQLADALQRRITIAAGILRQQLVGHDRPVGPERHHVGEGAATIDPKFPLVVAHAQSPSGFSGATLSAEPPARQASGRAAARRGSQVNEGLTGGFALTCGV
jgi:hypothetical protein